MTTYPDLNKLPSVLETAEVESVLQQILSALARDPSPNVVSIAELMVDAFHARGYRPDEAYDVNLCSQILTWVRQNWSNCDDAFANAVITLLANLDSPGRDEFLLYLFDSEKRPGIKQGLSDCIEELGIALSDGHGPRDPQSDRTEHHKNPQRTRS
jgi:hypothetical protein